jgi:hypothetical protein
VGVDEAGVPSRSAPGNTGRLAAGLGWVALGLTATTLLASSHWVDRDLWGHMAVGRETVRLGWPPPADPFSYMPTLRPFVYHEWLSGVTFFTMLMRAGSSSLKAAMVGLGLLTLAVAATTARRLGASPPAIVVVTLVALPSFAVGYIPIRPQVFTFLFFAVVLWILVAFDQGRRSVLLLLPPLFFLWANLHGGVVAGLGVIVLFVAARTLVGRPPWRLLIAGGAAAVATLANPYGLQYWQYLARALSMARPYIVEWMPVYHRLLEPVYWDTPTLLRDALRLVFIGVTLLVVIGARSRYWPGILILVVTGYLGLRHLKHLPLLAIAGVAFVPAHLTPLLERTLGGLRGRLAGRKRLATSVAAGIAALLVALLIVDLAVLTPWVPIVSARAYPVEAVDFLRVNGVRGNLATPFDWGQYVLWKLHPSVKVSFDGRYETVYPEEVAADNFNFVRGDGDWRRLLTHYPTDMVLVGRAHPVAPLMAVEPGWTLVHQDPISLVYFRADRSVGVWQPPAVTRGTLP